jgi:hypothetical protein
MKVTVIGKEYVKGTSKKTNSPFEANVAHVTYKQDGVEGLTCESVWLDCDSHPLNAIQVGKVYNIDRNSRGRIVDFTLHV